MAAMGAEEVQAKSLMLRPQRSHIAAAVDQDRPVADRRAAGFVVEIGDRGMVGGKAGIFPQIGHLAEPDRRVADVGMRSEEHTSELQSLMRNSYAVICLKKKKKTTTK